MNIKAQCEACNGTGIYVGFAEAKGEGVICLLCHGTGRVFLEYIPFTGRKTRKGITIVRLSRGSFIATGVGPTGNGVSYREWLEGKNPS